MREVKISLRHIDSWVKISYDILTPGSVYRGVKISSHTGTLRVSLVLHCFYWSMTQDRWILRCLGLKISHQFVCVRKSSVTVHIIVRRAGLLWSQQDFEWRWSVPLFKCLTVLEFSFILFNLCLLITFFNFIMNYVPIVTFWIFTYHKIWILSIMFCSIWSYWIIYFLACLEVSWRVVS